MEKLLKKIITLTSLIIFLFGLFIPFGQIFAQTPNYLTISVEKPLDPQVGRPVLGINESTKITATSDATSGGEIVSFPLTTGGVFSPTTCTMPALPSVQSCFVGFSSGVAGTYPLSANITIGGTSYPSNLSIPVLVTVKSTTAPPLIITPTCVPPQKLNDAKTACITDTDTTYTLLAPLPGLETIDTQKSNSNPCPLGNYLNILIKIIIGFSAVLAMVMIVVGGIEYMTSDLISSKEAGKETVTNAILGLLIALGAYLILSTINPQLLSVCLNNLPQAQITISPEQQRIIESREGKGSCVIVTDSSSNCNPNKLNPPFVTMTTAIDPLFNANSAQASAICQLESRAVANTLSGLDICSDGKAFSFGLFQINASAHRREIPVCNGAFEIPPGDGTSQGNPLHEYDVVAKDGKKYIARWSCKTVEPAYTNCKNYLINPANNIAFAVHLYEQQGWGPWTTYNSCKSKF